MKIPLANLTQIRLGPYLAPERDGGFAYLQVKNFDDRGELLGPPDTFVDLTRQQHNHALVEGDVLFVGKGYRQFAWAYDLAVGPAVASSIFFVLRPAPRRLSGAYLAALLNTPASRAFFAQLGAGTNIPSIRKSELEAFEIPLPPLRRQQQIAQLCRLQERSFRLRSQLAAAQDQYFQAALQRLTQLD